MQKEWIPLQGEMVWIKVFSNWSSGTYIGFDTVKNIHLVREDESGGGHLMSSSDVLPYSAMPNEPKKQTLEEAANNYITINKRFADTSKAFINGAEWQEKQMYSEDEVMILLIKCVDSFGDGLLPENETDKKVVEWFKTFKKNK